MQRNKLALIGVLIVGAFTVLLVGRAMTRPTTDLPAEISMAVEGNKPKAEIPRPYESRGSITLHYG